MATQKIKCNTYNVPTKNKFDPLEVEEEQMEAQEVSSRPKTKKKHSSVVFATKISNHGAMLELIKEKLTIVLI